MGKIINDTDKTVVVMDPNEVVHLPVMIRNTADGKLVEAAGNIGDAVAMVAWKMLVRHGKKVMSGVDYKYRFVDVIDGEYHVQFYKNVPDMPKIPDKA